MATGADKKPRQSTSRRGPPRWQVFVIYPTLALSLISAVPQWVERYQAYRLKIHDGRTADAIRQAALWEKNFSCSAAPFAWYHNPSDVKIDATICKSGDIFVQAMTPDNRQHLRWVPLDEIVKKASPGGGSLVPAANASTIAGLALPGSATVAGRLFHRAQTATVLCQKFIDGRRILRRVQTPEGCFDEIIDTYNGAVVERKPAPCVPQC